MDQAKDAGNIADLAIDELEAAGVDFSRSMGTHHFLYFRSRLAADAAAQELRAANYDVSIDMDVCEEGRWSVIASDETVVVRSNMRRVAVSMARIAEWYKGEYDGWETAVHLDENDPLCPLCDEFRTTSN